MSHPRRLPAFDGGFVLGAFVAVGLAMLLITGAGSAPANPLEPIAHPATTVPAPTTTSTVPTATTAPPAPTWPLTGLPLADAGAADHRAIAVKFDAHPSVRNYDGIEQADIVVEELVEGGLTRFVGLFHSSVPALAGPVRSVRTSDFDLLASLGNPLLAFSGGNDLTVQALYGTNIVPAPPVGWAKAFYHRSDQRSAPHDLEVDLGALASATPAAGGAGSLFERSTEAPAPPPGLPVGSVEVPFSRLANINFSWDPERGEWIRLDARGPLTDAAGRPLGWPTVVVLYTAYGRSPFDERSPEAKTVGGGEALLLQGGTAMPLRWVRDTPEEPFTLTDPTGRTVSPPPGRLLVELEPWAG